MRMTITPWRVPVLLLALLATLACSLTIPDQDTAPAPQEVVMVGDLTVAMAAPLDEAVYYEGVQVNVLARVENAGSEIDRAEILVDNAIVNTVSVPNPAGAPVFTIAQSWQASGLGTHDITVNVFRPDGSSASSQTASIEVISTDPNAVPVVSDNQDGGSNRGGGLLSSLLGGGNNNNGEAAPVIEDAPAIDSAPQQNQNVAATQAALPTPVPRQPTEPPPPTEEPASPTPTRPQATILVGANVRSGPSTQFGALGAFAQGEVVDALAVNPDGSWYKIQFYNAEGWVFSDLVEVSNADQLPVEVGPPTPIPATATFTPVPATATPVPAQVNLVFDGPVSIDPYPPDCGQTMEITVRVRNEGSESSGRSAALRIVDTHVDSGTRTETTAPIPEIGAGDSRGVDNIFLTVETNFDSTHRIQVFLDSNNEISETNEDDNASRAEALEYTLDKGDC